MQYDHLREVLPLYAQKRDMERKEEAARAKQLSQFPKTIEDWRRLGSNNSNSNNKNAQLYVARFLMADEPKREQMRDRARWAWRQTEPLIQMYKNNVSLEITFSLYSLIHYLPFFSFSLLTPIRNRRTDGWSFFFDRKGFKERLRDLYRRTRAGTLGLVR